ncbi:DNA-binding domain-containing protein [Photobacterium japonica]|uniref:HvfC/BufC family peptide modification chaperone n=1 Tax=Photobacterium japonica TaxID=2910235 RepID=UPI003D12361B
MDSSSPNTRSVQAAAPSLRELQQAFSHALHYHASDVTEQVQGGDFTPEQRIQLYRNNFIISLTDVLQATYPCTAAVVGEDCFDQLARQHVLNMPLSQGDVSDYGGGFADTLCAIMAEQPALAEAVPYLPDLARLEWLVDVARQHMPITPAFDMAQLAHINDDNIGRLRFEPAATTTGFTADHAVATLWLMIQRNEVEVIDMTQPESVIVQHREEGIWVQPTTPEGTALIALCQQQLPLSTASAAMLAMLGPLIQQNVFTAVHGLPDTVQTAHNTPFKDQTGG